MDDSQHAQTWYTYQSAWEDVSDAERDQRLRASVADDGTYLDPGQSSRGIAELTAVIQRFLDSTPGAEFTNYQFLEHHKQAIANWRLEVPGAPTLEGASHATFADDGRLHAIVGFFPS